MAEKMRRGGVIQFQSEDGREYHARHSEEPGLAERAAYFSQLGEGAAGKKFKYQAADEAMDIEDDSSPGSLSSVRSGREVRDVRDMREVQERYSPLLPTPARVDAVAAATAAAERERALRERERVLALREREMAERQHILQYEREYEHVYEERQRHLAAHPYYPRYGWDPRTEPRDRQPIVYAARPPRSITPRGPARTSSR